jgi:hypothetical protein
MIFEFIFQRWRARTEVNKKSNICLAMKTLQKEQQIISGWDMEFQFVCKTPKIDTIPFMLFTSGGKKPFTVFNNCMETSYFRLEKLDEETCCAVLTLLEVVDMEGNPAGSYDELYALRKTNSCIIVNLSCFCVINPFPPELVNKPLPIIEPKK